jgi:hypothetical protein
MTAARYGHGPDRVNSHVALPRLSIAAFIALNAAPRDRARRTTLLSPAEYSGGSECDPHYLARGLLLLAGEGDTP